ncbi:hypothetical protein GF336_03630 [Candidatus Woesearchaeota archaeon]|nr:hypothetical protein [Candidatus Woesearchaeota archaeon]
MKDTNVYCDKGSFGIHIKNSDNIVFENVGVYSAKNVNIEIENTDNVIIDNCSGYYAGRGHSDISHGICYRITDTVNSLVKNSKCYEAQHSGFTYRNAENSSFVNNLAHNTTKGNNMYLIDGCSKIKVSFNNLSFAAWSNIIIADSDDSVIYNNNLRNAGISGIFLDNAFDNKIYENIIENSKDKPIYKKSSQNNQIKDNVMEKQTSGIFLIAISMTILFLIIVLIILKKKQKI